MSTFRKVAESPVDNSAIGEYARLQAQDRDSALTLHRLADTLRPAGGWRSSPLASMRALPSALLPPRPPSQVLRTRNEFQDTTACHKSTADLRRRCRGPRTVVVFVASRKDARATGNRTVAAASRCITPRFPRPFSLPLQALGVVNRHEPLRQHFPADQLQLRGQQNYGRWKMLTKGFVAADSPERAQWEREWAEESRRDVAWSRRHGPVPGGASIFPWRDEREDSARASASAAQISG